MKRSISGRVRWLACTFAAALAAAVLRRWQLGSAFEEDTGLAIPGAPASVILICALVITGAWLVILSQPGRPLSAQAHWDQVLLNTGDRVYPVLEITAAFFAVAAIPVLFIVGVGQFQIYQDAMKAHIQPPTDNGLLTLATAGGAFLAALGLFQTGQDSLNPGRRGRGGFSIALPGVSGCVWLMESFRSHAANPVRWDYVPQLLAIVLGVAFYMDFAGLSAGPARPRRLLWLAGMTAVFSAVALAGTAAELAARPAAGLSLLCVQLADVLLLLSQTMAAAGILWQLPSILDSLRLDSSRPSSPPEPDPDPEPIQEIQEDADNE